MKADLLTPRGEAGSDATTGAWVGYGSAVEGHLLNAHLHGPAENKNLAPFSGRMNKAHSATVEEPLKKMVLNGGRYFRYHVTVTDGASDTFYPASIRCEVVEVDGAKQPVLGGYSQDVVIDQAGNVTVNSQHLFNAPAKQTLMAFTAKPGAGAGSIALAASWNQLKFPWTIAYGTVMQDVLATAYLAVRRYEANRGRIGTSAFLALPQTVVAITTGQVTNNWDELETVGVGMVADPLTVRPPASGEVGYQPAGEKWGLGAIKGHLLNHHVHGPAEPKNLAPMSGSLNQQFERDIESVVKEKVLTDGSVLRYEVQMLGATGLFGFDDAPEGLAYELYEYQRNVGFGLDYENIANWTRSASPIKAGQLPNSKDDDY